MSNHTLKPLPNQTLAYTDGACRSNGSADAIGGFGAVLVLSTGEQIELSGGDTQTTNNRMELLGAIVALENSPTHLPIQLWTDSSYVKNGITTWIHSWKKNNWRKTGNKSVLNVDLWQRLDTACQNRVIDWQWVKGHAGHEGNERADQLANQGIDNLPNKFNKTILQNSQNTEQNFMNNPNHTTATAPNFDNLPDDYYQNYDNLPPQDFDNLVDFDDFNPNDFDNAMSDDEQGDFLLNQLDDPSQYLQNNTVNNNLLDENAELNDTETADTETDDLDDTSSDGTGKKKQTKQKKPPQKMPLAERFKPFVNENEQFVAQNDDLVNQRPNFDGNTQSQNNSFVPLLPIAKNHGVANRQLILDTETTGFDFQNGDRIIEIGVVELVNRRFTGEKLHVYINPLVEMNEDVIKVHGIHDAFVADMPTFEQVGQAVFDFLAGAELIAHNANFDMGFLQAEFARMGLPNFDNQVSVTDSLAIAKQMYAGQRNTLDALVKRLDVGKQDRTFHGALLDAEILAEVYLAMTGGQVSLGIDDGATGASGGVEHQHFSQNVQRFLASTSDEQAHLDWLNSLKQKYPMLASNWGIVEESSDEITT